MISINGGVRAVIRGMVLGATVAIVPTISVGLVELEWSLPKNLAPLYLPVRPGALIAFLWGGDDYHSGRSFTKASVLFAVLLNGLFGALLGAAGKWISYARPFQFPLKSVFWATAACAAALATRNWWWVHAWWLATDCAAWWATLTALIAFALALDWRICAARL